MSDQKPRLSVTFEPRGEGYIPRITSPDGSVPIESAPPFLRPGDGVLISDANGPLIHIQLPLPKSLIIHHGR